MGVPLGENNDVVLDGRGVSAVNFPRKYATKAFSMG
jgi:hypothetical protein